MGMDFMIKYFLKSSLFFQLNITLLIIFLTFILFSLNDAIKHNKFRSKVYKKISEIKIILNSHSEYIHQNHPGYKIDKDFFLNFISDYNKKIESDFNKINVGVKSDIIFFKSVPFVNYRVKLNLTNFNESDELVFFGYLKENFLKPNLFRRWGYFEKNCTEEMNSHTSCNLGMQMNWYCVSNRDRYLPDQLKYLHLNNISSRWVPFRCRW